MLINRPHYGTLFYDKLSAINPFMTPPCMGFKTQSSPYLPLSAVIKGDKVIRVWLPAVNPFLKDPSYADLSSLAPLYVVDRRA